MRADFGTTAEGAPVELAQVRSAMLEMSVIPRGAAIRDLRPRSGPMAGRSLVLGLNSLADYEAHSPHFGAIAGRCANRIAGGRLTLDRRAVELTRNTPDGNHLHGGDRGFGARIWAVAGTGEGWVTLVLVSPDGEEGYPGTVLAEVTYRLEGAAVIAEMTATTDAPTLVNLAQHSYFNLDGYGDILGHRLAIATDHVTPTDTTLVPTGEILPVDGTAYDFRQARAIRPPGAAPVVYDLNYCLAAAPRAEPVFAARLEGAASAVAMEVWTTEPGLQFYDGGTIDVPVSGLDGCRFAPYSGLCLEAQRWPDAPNHQGFPSAVLRPGETYRQRTEFRFDW